VHWAARRGGARASSLEKSGSKLPHSKRASRRQRSELGGENVGANFLLGKMKNESGSLRAAAESLMQARTNILRQGEELAVAIKVDGFARSVEHRVAVVALAEVGFKSFFQLVVQLTIKII
jgi:hypothetical protein